MLASTTAQRRTDYDALVTALTTAGLVGLTWIDGATTKRYWCHVDSIEPSVWLTRASVALIAPKPDAEVVP